MPKIECEFELERDTKGALFYAQVKDGKPYTTTMGAEVGNFYLRKSACDGQMPKGVKMTLEF